MSIRVLGIDPGKRNGWWCLFREWGPGRRLLLLDTAQMDMLPDEKVMERCEHYWHMAQEILDTAQPDLVFAERFITRPRGGRGNVSEPVNLLLGQLYNEARRRNIKVRYCTSSQHKVWRRKVWGGEEEWQAWCLNRYPRLDTEHQRDALSIAYWGWIAHRQEEA